MSIVQIEYFPNEPPKAALKPYDYATALVSGNQYLSPDEMRAQLDQQVDLTI